MNPRAQSDPRCPMVPVSVGELADKISILKIKCARLSDALKISLAKSEVAALERVAGDLHLDLDADIAVLGDVNEKLWDVEDALRACEANQDFGPTFIALARQVYILNDTRARLKADVNRRHLSMFFEVKSYA